MKKLHDQYGIVVSFYVFYSWNVEDGRFNLAEATDRFQEEFSANSDWLRFGFHAKDAPAYETIDAEEELYYYNITIKELLRITGSEDCIDNFVRLDRYYATAEMIEALTETDYGIVGLLTSDNPDRNSYALSGDERIALYDADWYADSNGVQYTPTDIRLEGLEGRAQFRDRLVQVSDQEQIVIFTHEWFLSDKNVQKYMKWFAMFGERYQREFAFPEDRIKTL